MRTPRRYAALLVVLVGLVSGVLVPLVAAGPAEASTTVRRAQRALAALGCNPGPADGTAGLWTRSAAFRFQAANGLARTGRLTARTRTRLAAEGAVRCDRRPVAGSSTGRRIVISQRQDYVWLVRASGRVVAQGPMADNPAFLDRGTYRSGAKCGRAARIRDNSDASGTLRLQNFVRFAPCGIGFHRVPVRRSTGGQIHRDYLLGTDFAVSHGCIRVTKAMSARIWRFAKVGTKVVVTR